MGIVRCHSQAQRTKTLTELHAPKGLPELSKDYRSKYDRPKHSSRWNSQPGKYRSEYWTKNSKHPKPLSNKMAFALLMELRKSQEGKNHLQYLQPELTKILDRKNPFPANININNIDSASLDELPGIGPSTVRKILKFREKLGGFYSASTIDRNSQNRHNTRGGNVGQNHHRQIQTHSAQRKSRFQTTLQASLRRPQQSQNPRPFFHAASTTNKTHLA